MLTTAEVAEILGVTRRRVVQMIDRKQLPATSLGKGKKPVYVVDRKDLKLVKNRPKAGRPKKSTGKKAE